MRIVTGTLKGRVIPFTSRRHGDIRVTSARLKESLFAMLGADLSATTFLDLCAGTGQMGLEASSRGARVIAAEPDRRRHECLKQLIAAWRVEDFELIGVKAQIVIERLQGRPCEPLEGIFIDPPYEATLASAPLAVALLQRVAAAGLCADGGLVAVQHSKRLEVPDAAAPLRRERQRRFGDSLLSVYRPA